PLPAQPPAAPTCQGRGTHLVHAQDGTRGGAKATHFSMQAAGRTNGPAAPSRRRPPSEVALLGETSVELRREALGAIHLLGARTYFAFHEVAQVGEFRIVHQPGSPFTARRSP